MENSTSSFFEKRIYGELGLTPEQNTVELYYPGIHDTYMKNETKLFEEDEAGNIVIKVYDIEKKVITYKANKHEKEYYNRLNVFQIIRLKEPEIFKDKEGREKSRKYILPSGAGTYPYFPISLCDKYARADKITTLTLTEGYLKAMKGSLCGIDIVGLSSITHIKEKPTQMMYEDILKLIKRCEVENVIILFDGDCRQISIKDLEEGKDLIRRPQIFFNMVCKCRELLTDLKKNLYFSTIKSDEIPGNPKGIDDLLISEKDIVNQVAEELISFSRPSRYFERFDITYDTRKLYRWYKIANADQFYEFHQKSIQDKTFIFSGTQYKFDQEKGEIIVVVPASAKNFARVGDGYWEFVLVPNKYGQLEKQLHQRKKETIKDDYGKSIFEHIPKYKAFCNVPSHIHYKPIINQCFNRYYEFEHEPEEGDCDTTLYFVRHIFGEQYDLGLDYLQLLYQKPQQILPILCLVSSENNTGKSTFIKWLKAIFTNNCTIVGNAELSNDFNAGWATKLLIACEESFIDKKPVVEKIKALSTGDKIVINQKGKDHIEVDFFGKFILASNNEDSFIIASKADIRYWVRKISVPKNDNVKLLSTIIPEIPAFLFYLNRRELSTKQQSRMWFAPSAIHTDALNRLIEQNLPKIIKEIREKVRQFFIDFNDEELHITPKMINTCMLGGRFDTYYILKECRTHFSIDILRDDSGNRKLKTCLYKWKVYNDFTDTWDIRSEKQIGQPLVFKRKEFLTDYETQTILAQKEKI